MSTEDENFEAAVSLMRLILVDAVQSGWLRSVAHGYCWYCNTEGPVLEVMTHEVPGNPPSQPPRCESCFMDSGLTVLSDPDVMESLVRKSIADWLDGDEAP